MAVLVAALGATLVAQAKPAPNDGPQAPKRLFIDNVVASINDSTILQSKLFAATEGVRRSARAQNREPTLRDLDRLMRQKLMQLISHHQMAQAAKSFSKLKPEQIEQLLRSELDRDKEEQVRDLGSYLLLAEELEREGRTWQTYAQEQRIEKLHEFAKQFAVYERLRKQSTLYLTPRMLRQTYEAEKDFFVHPAMAELALVIFSGATAEQDAKKAGDIWSNGVWTAREIAAKFDSASPLLNVRAKSLPTNLREFGLAGPVGNVSEPIRRNDGSFAVAKVLVFVPSRDGTFDDPAVQQEVRLMARKRVLEEFELQALERARHRTAYWIYQGPNRIQPKY